MKDGETEALPEQIYQALFFFPYFPLKFCSEEYLIHLEIIRKGENLANWDMKGGLELRNIHEVTKATKGFLFWLEQLYL